MRKGCARGFFFPSAELKKTPSFDGEKCKWNYFRGREKCTQSHMNRWFSRKVHVMHAANYPARRVKHDIEVNHGQGHFFIHDPQEHENIGDHDCSKQLKKILHPQVHHPEPPEIGCSEMRSG